jgi:butyrate kinase
MPRTFVDALITEKSLSYVSQSDGGQLLDMLLRNAPEDSQVKNVCAKLSVELSDKVDAVVDLLGISKRRFLEAAIIDAVDKAHQIMEAEGVLEANALQVKQAGGEA